MRWTVVMVSAALAACGGDPDPGAPDAGPQTIFPQKPECVGDPVAPLHGQHQLVISSLAIGSGIDGFDLDHDGHPDNKLAPLAGIAKPQIDAAFARFALVIPLELYDFPTAVPDSCVKMSFYLGHWSRDDDHDGYYTGVPGGDCDDHDPDVNPGHAEVPGNGKDDNCNGLADEAPDGTPSSDVSDSDHDGVTIKDGDCDDTNPAVNPKLTESCDDGYDNDCSGVADRAKDGAAAICTPYDEGSPDLIAIDPASFGANGRPKVIFDSGQTVMENGVLRLHAGPSFFSATVPVTAQLSLDLELSGATIVADVVADPGGNGIALKNGHLGGVLDAYTLDRIRGLDVAALSLTPDQSLLDAVFANILGQVLALPRDEASGCYTPDIDVDKDGLEAFCDTDPNDGKFEVDTCIDGDGTVYHDMVGPGGQVIMQCTEFRNLDGTLKFVDGISAELNFEAVPARLPPPT